MIAHAARIRGLSASDYVRSVVVMQARTEIHEAHTRTIVLTPEEQLAFWQALEQPTSLTPRQRELGRVMRGLARQALQNEEKYLSATRALVDEQDSIAGCYTLATGQVEFGDLPQDIVKRLPRRALPVAVLAWLGVDQQYNRRGLGTRLLAQALANCHEVRQISAFVAVTIDCIDEPAKAFYKRWDFREMPGRPMRLFLPFSALEELMSKDGD
jgi:ribosomal protein S18 acetylase RimI-like enzyme